MQVLHVLTTLSVMLALGCSSNKKSGSNAPGLSEDGDAGFNISAPEESSVKQDVTLAWQKLKEAAYYDLIVARDPECTNQVLQFNKLTVDTQTITFIEEGTYFVCLVGVKENGKDKIKAKNNGVQIIIKKDIGSAETVEAVPTATPTATPTNAAPSINLDAPAGDDDSSAIGSNVTISWNDSDVDNDASITFYYKTSNSGACNIGTQIGSAVSEDDATNSIDWNTTGLAEGFYYICAVISDSVNAAVTSSYSGRLVLYPSGTCTWVGDSSTDWATAGNWVGCAGTPDANTESVVILEAASNQPVLAANTTIHSFGSGKGGGELTIAAGATLTLDHASAISSSISVKGQTAACTTCVLNFTGDAPVIGNDATLTLKDGIIVTSSIAYGHFVLNVGDGTSVGHFKTLGGANKAQWPVFYKGAIKATGKSALLAKMDIDGVGFSEYYGHNFVPIDLNQYYDVVKLDRAVIDSVSNNSFPQHDAPYIVISNCNTAQFNDLSWEDIEFVDPLDAGYWYGPKNIYTTCSGVGPITVSGSGLGYGPVFESDSNGIINWANGNSLTCTWTGTNGSNWADSGNWSNCSNGRGNYPDQNDWAIVPVTANQPTVTGRVMVRGFASGTGGGTVTISANSYLGLAPGDQINSDIKVQGATATCSTCFVMAMPSLSIVNNATFTAKKGVGILVNSNVTNYVGKATSPGHLRTDTSSSTNPAEWPVFAAYYYYYKGFAVEGVDANNRSSVSFDGLRVEGLLSDASFRGIEFQNFYQIDGMDRVKFATISWVPTFASSYIILKNCANGRFNDPAWDGLDFASPIDPGGYNINASACSSLAANEIIVSSLSGGTNAAYGVTYENDPNGAIGWQ